MTEVDLDLKSDRGNCTDQQLPNPLFLAYFGPTFSAFREGAWPLWLLPGCIRKQKSENSFNEELVSKRALNIFNKMRQLVIGCAQMLNKNEVTGFFLHCTATAQRIRPSPWHIPGLKRLHYGVFVLLSTLSCAFVPFQDVHTWNVKTNSLCKRQQTC